MLPRTDLIISYKPLPHVARSARVRHQALFLYPGIAGDYCTWETGTQEQEIFTDIRFHAKLQK